MLSKTIRIICLIIAGIALYIVGIKLFSLSSSLYNEQETNSLLTEDFSLAKSYGNLTKKQLNKIKKEYSKLLKENGEQIYSYLLLESKYKYYKSAYKKVSSSIPGDQNIIKQCEDNKCIVTYDNCYTLLDGESLNIKYSDYHINIETIAKRISKTNWDTNTSYNLNQKFSIEIIETKNNKTGKSKYYSKLIEDNGTPKGLVLETVNFKIATQEQLDNGMQWFSPSIKLGVHQPVFNEWIPIPFLSVSFMKYSMPKYDLFDFLQVGIGIKESAAVFLFTPASYNFGSQIPIINNLWFGLDITADTQTNFSFGLSISTTL